MHFNVQSNNPSLPFRQGRLGIFRLDTPLLDVIAAKDLYDVDIVAIHGLCGDAHKSWTHENGTNWLRDLLPQAIPGARIFSYGYPSQLFFSRSVAGIRDYAVQLLSSLASERENDVSTTLLNRQHIIMSLIGIGSSTADHIHMS